MRGITDAAKGLHRMKSAPKDYRKGNLEAARIILETPDVYGAGMVEWARRVLGIIETEESCAE